MNEINTTCQTSAVGVIYLTYGQLASLTIANCIVSASSLSEILIAFFVQNLHLVLIYDKTCSVTIASQFLSTFLLRLFGYTIGIIGVDRYIRIKYKMRFKSILTAKFMMSMKVLVWMTAFLHVVWTTFGLVEKKTNVVRTVILVIDGSAFAFDVFLQLRTVREINALPIYQQLPYKELLEKY